MNEHRRLPLVTRGQELRGVGPKEFERLAERARPRSPEHRGLLFIAETLARPVLKSCVPPSAQEELVAGLRAARLWAKGELDERGAQQARARCFGAVTAIENLTEQALLKARPHLRTGPATPLDEHADSVTTRYVRLAAHFATSGVCHLLDARENPALVLEVYADLQAALAYQGAGLGAARHAPFRQAAWDQATWESSRMGAAPRRESAAQSSVGPLAVQVFHEYLGGRFRVQADSARLRMDQFISWVLAPARL